MRKFFLILVVLANGLTGTAVAQTTLPPERFTIKQDSPDVGTNLRKNNVTGGVIPFNRRYSEMTPEQKGFIRARYESIGPNDEPPFPAEGLELLMDAMSKVQKKFLVSGPLEIHVEVGANGEGRSVKIFKSPDPEMAKVAAQVLLLTKYKPGVCDGVPCVMPYPFQMNFSVRR